MNDIGLLCCGHKFQNAAFKFYVTSKRNLTKGCKFLDAALGPAFGATSQALHAARLKDLVRSLNVKSALTIRDLCPPMFPEAAIHASGLH